MWENDVNPWRTDEVFVSTSFAKLCLIFKKRSALYEITRAIFIKMFQPDNVT